MTELIIRQIYTYKVYIKYVIAGGTAASIDLGLLFIFTDLFGIWYITSAALAFMLAFFVSFSLQKFWTFRDSSTDGIYQQMSMYFVIAVVNLLLNTGLMYVLVDYFHIWYMFSQVFVGGLVACWSFLIYKFYIFKNNVSINS